MKKIAGICLCCALALPFLLTWVGGELTRELIRTEVGHRISLGIGEADLTVIAVHKREVDQLEWEHESEFEYRGEMYDVVRSESTVDSLIFYCWHDVKESLAKAQFDQTISGLLDQIPCDGNGQIQLNSFSKNLICVFSKSPAAYVQRRAPVFARRDLRIDDMSIPPPVPPPRVSFILPGSI